MPCRFAICHSWNSFKGTTGGLSCTTPRGCHDLFTHVFHVFFKTAIRTCIFRILKPKCSKRLPKYVLFRLIVVTYSRFGEYLKSVIWGTSKTCQIELGLQREHRFQIFTKSRISHKNVPKSTYVGSLLERFGLGIRKMQVRKAVEKKT